MRKLHLILVIGALSAATSCSKSVSEEDGPTKSKSSEFQASVLSHKYKLVSFYADKPIDYISNDSEVRAETDLWPYVKNHIVDDENFFGANGKLTVYQKEIKIGGNNAEAIETDYAISVKGTDVMVKFVDYLYNPLEYKLHEFNDAYFTVYVDGPSGSKLFSKYARVE